MAFSRQLSLIQLAQQDQKEAQAANARREAEIRNLYQQNISALAPGGVTEQAGQRAIEQTYSQDVSRMIGAGLYGTTAVESTAGAARRQGRLTLESLLEARRSGARSEYAQFIERIQNEYPDLSAVERGYAAQASMPSGTSSLTGWTSDPGASHVANLTGWKAEPSTTDYAELYRLAAQSTTPVAQKNAVEDNITDEEWKRILAQAVKNKYQPIDITKKLNPYLYY